MLFIEKKPFKNHTVCEFRILGVEREIVGQKEKMLKMIKVYELGYK